MEPTVTPQMDDILPLEKLVKIPRGKKRITIRADLLPKIDLSQLKHSVKFKLPHPVGFHTNVSVSLAYGMIRTETEVYTLPEQWPSGGYIAALYAAALATSALPLMLEETEDNYTTVYPVSLRNIMKFGFALKLPVSGQNLLEIIRQKLDVVVHDLPRVLSNVAAGPNPIPLGNEEVDEDE